MQKIKLEGSNMNDKDLNMTDFNEEEKQTENVCMNWEQVEVKKEGFWEKHKYGIGVFTGMFSIILALVVAYTAITASGTLLVIGGGKVHPVPESYVLDEKAVAKINEIYSYMYLYYYEDFAVEDVQELMYKGVMAGLDDPYSVYYTASEYEDLKISTSGVFCGIGAALSQNVNTMEVTISKVYKGTPAEEAGLKDGDRIVKVEDIEATSMVLDKLVQNVRGEEGTSVHLQVYRESTGEILEFDVVRRKVELPSIEGEMLEGQIGYIQITDFQEKTAEQFKTMVSQLEEEGMQGLIVDLRANPGGLLTSVNEILDRILPEGLLVYTEDKYGNRAEYSSDAVCMDIPFVVLVDENSASASEIFAGAIKDYEYGTLVGTTTFGKGIVQNIIPLSNGDAIKLTTSKYFTPNGNYIHEVGVEPDVVIEYEYSGPTEQAYDKQYDNQFLKAVEIMKEQLANE